MNKSTSTHLQIMVERVVRPVPASTARKQRMREEFLAHVTAVFNEELARLGDEKTALKRTQQRFGNPDELTGQLLKSMPAKDAGERFMRRVSLLTVAWLVLFGAGEFPAFPGRILLECGFALVGSIFLADLMRRAYQRPPGHSWKYSVLIASSTILLFLGLRFGSLAFLFDEWTRPKDLSQHFMLMAALTWGIMNSVLETVATLSQLEWERLPVE